MSDSKDNLVVPKNEAGYPDNCITLDDAVAALKKIFADPGYRVVDFHVRCISQKGNYLRLGWDRDHVGQARGVKKSAEPQKVPAGYVALVCREDEMLTLHRDGKYLATLYASCPEQADDFIKKYKDRSYPAADSWEDLLAEFKTRWKSKYPEED